MIDFIVIIVSFLLTIWHFELIWYTFHEFFVGTARSRTMQLLARRRPPDSTCLVVEGSK